MDFGQSNVIRKEPPGTTQKTYFLFPPFFSLSLHSAPSFPLHQHKINHLPFPSVWKVHLYLTAAYFQYNQLCYSFTPPVSHSVFKMLHPIPFPSIDCAFQKIKRCTSHCNLKDEKLFCSLEHVFVKHSSINLGPRTRSEAMPNNASSNLTLSLIIICISLPGNSSLKQCLSLFVFAFISHFE